MEFVCCKCNRPVEQPHCKLITPDSKAAPHECPFMNNYSAEWKISQDDKESQSASQQLKEVIAILSGLAEAGKITPTISSTQMNNCLYNVIAKLTSAEGKKDSVYYTKNAMVTTNPGDD